MNTKRKQQGKVKSRTAIRKGKARPKITVTSGKAGPALAHRRMTLLHFRVIVFTATLVLAGVAIVLQTKDPVVWGFLGTALGLSMGQSIK